MGTITGPLTPVEPTQSANSLDIVPAMQQHMGPHILDLEQEGSLWSMSTVMPELGDWWIVTITTKRMYSDAGMGTQQVFDVKVHVDRK